MTPTQDAVFVLIDVQGRLAEVMHDHEALFANLEKLVKGMQALQVPILWLEQIPQKMGPTIPALRELLAAQTPLAKSCFSAAGLEEFSRQLKALGRRRVLLAGIETHVCVYQTAADLLREGYGVEVVTDAVSSRTLSNKLAGIDKIRFLGGGLTTVEMILFELMRSAEHPAFRDILRIVK